MANTNITVIQFWHRGTDGKPREACGSDSVYYPDGRWGMARLKTEAHRIAMNRGFIGYSLHTGQMNRPSFRQVGEEVIFDGGR